MQKPLPSKEKPGVPPFFAPGKSLQPSGLSLVKKMLFSKFFLADLRGALNKQRTGQLVPD